MSEILNALNWRYATKEFDKNKKVSEKDLEEIEEATRLSPSSFGLQPWRIVEVRDPKIREELRKHAWNQSQITDASNLFVLCAIKNMSKEYVENFVKQISQIRGVPIENLKGYQDMMINFREQHTEESITQWAKHQAYIALGIMLTTCASKKIDACPMEGFDRKKFDEILELDKEGLSSTVLCTIGYRSKSDNTANYKKVRFSKEDLFIRK